MSLCYDFQKWTMVTLASIAISLTVGLLMQYAHGETAKEKVDKLIQDTIKNNTFDKEYKAELIKRMQNTTCLTEAVERVKEGYPVFNPEYLTTLFTTQELVDTLRLCVLEGKIK
jgi:hypothetical protein